VPRGVREAQPNLAQRGAPTLNSGFQFGDAIRLVGFAHDGNNLAVVIDNGTLRMLRAMTLTEADDEYMTFYSSRGK